MSVPAFAWALERGRTLDLSPACRLVLIYLADMANGERVCWPGQETIADFTGLAVRTVRTAIHGLAELQLIRVDAKPGFAARFHILRPDTPANSAEVKASHPGRMSRATPANGADHPRQNVPTHPGTSLQEGRHITTVTPANGADDPSITQVRDPKRRASAPEARKDSQNSEPQGGTPPPAPPPPQAPVIGTTPGGSSYKPPNAAVRQPGRSPRHRSRHSSPPSASRRTHSPRTKRRSQPPIVPQPNEQQPPRSSTCANTPQRQGPNRNAHASSRSRRWTSQQQPLTSSARSCRPSNAARSIPSAPSPSNSPHSATRRWRRQRYERHPHLRAHLVCLQSLRRVVGRLAAQQRPRRHLARSHPNAPVSQLRQGPTQRPASHQAPRRKARWPTCRLTSSPLSA